MAVTVGRDVGVPTTRRADVERKAEIVRVLVEVGNAADAVVAQVLDEFGVPTSVAGTLWALVPGTEPPTMREVAARQPHPADGRKRTLALTGQGRELWEVLRTRLHASGLFAGLDAQEQNTLLALLKKMRNPQRR
jgi:hypothetical protein